MGPSRDRRIDFDPAGIEAFFERTLERLGLSERDLRSQGFIELQDSLIRLDELIRDHASLGVLKVVVSAQGSVIISNSSSESQFEYGALPLLLERKRTLQNMLRIAREEIHVTDLESLVRSVPEDGLRTRLSAELASLVRRSSERQGNVRPDFGFIAMPMSADQPELLDVLDAIQEAANAVGVRAERVDDSETNERISDRMLMKLQESGHVIVDLSYERPNVYYEAGYAHGLGKIPIFVARSGTEIHFDLRDFPVLRYASMRELRESLIRRFRTLQAQAP